VDQSLSETRRGLLLGLGAYLLWGAFPLYFRALRHVDAVQIVAHRILWSLVLLAALLTIWRRWPMLAATVRSPRLLLLLGLTAVLISCNWLVYIWAVAHGHVIEASLGYYLNPLVNVLLGTLVLRERLSRPQLAAVILAGAGVAVLAAGSASGVWISLSLAFSFALYGFLRKIIPVEAVEGLSIETALLAPVALGGLLLLHAHGEGAMGRDFTTDLLLILSGAATAVPLLMFNAAAKQLPYSTLGFLQFLTPSMQFLLAVLVFGERMTFAHVLCFGAIWVAVAIFAAEGFRSSRAAARERQAADV
jgi:chloramphenicol-sensitive protein RarD